jgi:N4-gp56 family major capsid protein
MGSTVIAWGDPKAQKAWSTGLAVDQIKKAYFEKKFVGTDENSIIQRKTELESDPGDRVSFDLSVQLRGEATEGDARLEGKEESQKYYTDEVAIDQVRHAVSAGGAMTRKRTNLNLRGNAKRLLSDYWSRFYDELMFIYLSGARGINKDFLFPLDYSGRASNAIQPPDAGHLLYGGAATSKASMVAGDKMTTLLIEKAQVKSTMLQAQDPEAANMVPVNIDGEEHYVCVMNPFQAHDLRTAAGSVWIDIQKAAAAAEGRNNPIFKGGLGMVKNVVLHEHRNGIRFSDYGAGANVAAGRALFMGRQAGVVAYGTQGGLRWSWKEEMKDYDNEPTVAAGAIFGIKKARFNSRDFGVLSLDTACVDPNA